MTEGGRGRPCACPIRKTEDGRQRAVGAGLVPALYRRQRAKGRSLPTVIRHPSSVICCLSLAFVLIFSVGCGRKSPPFISQEKDAKARVDQLEGVWDDRSLVLKGVVQGDDEALSLIVGCRVYYAWYSLDRPPCDGCPIEMKSFRDITDQIISDDQFECRLPAFKQKGICFVMVRIMEKESRLGPASGRIKLISDT